MLWLGRSSPAGQAVPSAEYERLAAEAEALRNTVASLSVRMADLEQTNSQLTRIRQRGLGDRGVLIPARVVADDLLAWRDSALINRGALSGVQPGAAVASSVVVDAGTEDGLRDGLAALAGEVLIGHIEHAGTHTARIKLLSDPASRRPVVIWRLEDGVASTLEGDPRFWLVGQGAGKIAVVEVDHRYIEENAIRPGDLVITPPTDPTLPVPLTIGTITKIAADPENNLLYNLTVETSDHGRLRRVHVVSLAPAGS